MKRKAASFYDHPTRMAVTEFLKQTFRLWCRDGTLKRRPTDFANDGRYGL